LRKNFNKLGRTIKHLFDISMVKGRMRRPERRMRLERKQKKRPTRRRWRIKASRMCGLGGSNPPRVVQDLSLLLPPFVE
jgi:hypothetical protein